MDVGIDSPFCGTSMSQSATSNRVLRGECGKCQVLRNGGGGESTCNSSLTGICPKTNSCGRNSVCCASGKSVPRNIEPPFGAFCNLEILQNVSLSGESS